MKRVITAEQKRLNADLWIITAVTLIVLGMYSAFQSQVYSVIINTTIHVLPRTLLAAAFQFGLAGLGITIVTIIRKERFSSYGLKLKGALRSIVFCILCFVPYIIFTASRNQAANYLPFQSVWTTKEALSSSFPVNAATMLVIATVWGFFEGFNYVVISEKINRRYPAKSRWLNWGAIFCAIMCILIHGIIGVTAESFIEMITVIIIIYGMLMVKEFSKNAWGCIFIFVFLWNAF